LVIYPEETEARNDCAVEDQQQYDRQTGLRGENVHSLFLILTFKTVVVVYIPPGLTLKIYAF
jgi:hypothetical protein